MSMSMLKFPENIVDREKFIFEQVLNGNFEASWVQLEYQLSEKKVKLDVMHDALKVAGVRVNVSAKLQQQLADVFDASLLTAQIADLMFIHATHVLNPSPQPISSTTASMLLHDSRVTKQLGTYSSGIISTVGKHWILDKKLEQSKNVACNYGWHFVGSSFQGIKGYPAASQFRQKNSKPVNVIQPNATAHDSSHTDYSQICQLVSQQCWIDGVEHRFSDLLQDSNMCSLVNHNGTLKNIRQPGVQQITGQVVLFPTLITN
jgi:hypothetical protein